MKKSIVRAVIISSAIILTASALYWAIIINLTGKRAAVPEPVSRPETVSGTEAVPAPQTVSRPADSTSSPLLMNAKGLLSEGKRGQAVKILEEIVSSKPGSKEAYESLLMLADVYKTDGNLLKAKEIYNTIAKECPEQCDYPDIQKRLSALNMDILFSPIPTETSEIYIVQPGDSLTKIARAYSTTVELIKRANGLESDSIRPDMKLKVQKVPFSIVVDKSQSTLTLILGNEALKTYTVSTGKNNSTPTGTFKIKNKITNPVWYSTKAVVPPGSPENVLGSRWMGISTTEPGYGIHGTTDPKSIGYQCTEGCVRMYNSDAEELFDIIPPETEISIID